MTNYMSVNNGIRSVLLPGMLSGFLLLSSSAIAAPAGTLEATRLKPSVQAESGKNRPGMTYTMKSISLIYRGGKIIHNNAKQPDENDAYCMCRYPVFYGQKSSAAVNNIVDDSIAESLRLGDHKNKGESIEILSKHFLKEYESFRKKQKSELPYQFELNGKVLLNRSGIMTLGVYTTNYTGGAHGSNRTEYLVFDTESGKRLRVKDVFVKGFEKRLNQLIDTRFRRMMGLTKTERLDSEKGTLFKNSIQFNQNFALTNKGVSFLYNEYEIAAYVYGQTEVDLSYKELAGIILPGVRI